MEMASNQSAKPRIHTPLTPGQVKKLRKTILLSLLFGVLGAVLLYFGITHSNKYYFEPKALQREAYNEAVDALAAGDEEGAIKAFAAAGSREGLTSYIFGVSIDGLGAYKDSNGRRFALCLDALREASPGDTVYYGVYEQDNDFANSAEPILWRVLERAEDGTLTLISEYSLDCRPYNNDVLPITWEWSDLRRWLNGEFYTRAFTAEERAKLVSTTHENPGNEDYGTRGGGSTTDAVYLLSTAEAEAFFASDAERCASGTKYAKAWGANYRDATGWWWLRTPGESQFYVAMVHNDGTIYYSGYAATTDSDGAIRPVIKVNCDQTPLKSGLK